MPSLFYWLLLAVVLSSAMSENAYNPRSCSENEQRPENQAACEGLPLGTLVSYPGDCNRFLVCDCEYPTVRKCGTGLWFNNTLKTCDWPQNVQCEPSADVTSNAPTTLSAVSDVVCQNLPSHLLLPYAGNCAAYIECIEGQAQLRRCPADHLFNPDLRICDYAKDVECFDGNATTTANTPTSTPSTTTTPNPGLALCRGQANGTTYAYEDDCSWYYFCSGNDEVLLLSCPYFNYYNPNTGNCGPDVSPEACRVPATTTPATTLSPAKRCQGQAAGQTLPLESNCGQYIMCTASGAATVNCPNNNYYNPATGNCGPTTAPDACRATSTTTEATTEVTTIATTTWPTHSEGVCGTYSNGELIAYPGNCGKYISCEYPVPIAYECGDGLEFNAELQKCTTPAEANCNGGPTTTTTTIITTAPTTDPSCDTSPQTTVATSETTTSETPSSETPTTDISSSETSSNGTPPTEAPITESSSTETPTTETTAIPTTPPPNQNVCCGQSLGTRLPFPGDIRRYIVCDYPVPIVVTCPSDTIFDDQKLECAHSSSCTCSQTAVAASDSIDYLEKM